MPNIVPSEISTIFGSPAIIALAIDKARIYSKIDELNVQLRHVEKRPEACHTKQFLQQEIDHCEDELAVLSSMMESVDISQRFN